MPLLCDVCGTGFSVDHAKFHGDVLNVKLTINVLYLYLKPIFYILYLIKWEGTLFLVSMKLPDLTYFFTYFLIVFDFKI